MSNATQDSPNPGRKRRRRNRGGQNRNENQNPQNRQGGHGGQRRDGDQNRNREGGDRHRDGGNSRGPRERRPMPEPAKLSWWQKILKAIGLYKEPVRPTRQERIKEAPAPAGERQERTDRPVKSNIRIARPQERKETERGPVESPRLYIGNLSYDVTEGDLTDLFKGIGGVRNVEIVYNRNTHRSKGYGFVEMLHVDDAKRSVEVFHDQPFMGRKLNVSGAKSKGFDEREEQEDRPDRQERRPRQAPAAAAQEAPSQVAPAVVAAAVPVAAVAAVVATEVAEAAAPVSEPAAEVTPVIVPAAVAEAPVAEQEVIPTAEAVAPTEEQVEEKTEEKTEEKSENA